MHTKGRSVRASYFQLKHIPNQRRKENRLAVVVAKKVSKKAPIRNTIRRRVYEAVRAQWPLIVPAHDMVITVFDERAADIPATELNRAVVELLHKAELYKTI